MHLLKRTAYFPSFFPSASLQHQMKSMGCPGPGSMHGHFKMYIFCLSVLKIADSSRKILICVSTAIYVHSGSHKQPLDLHFKYQRFAQFTESLRVPFSQIDFKQTNTSSRQFGRECVEHMYGRANQAQQVTWPLNAAPQLNTIVADLNATSIQGVNKTFISDKSNHSVTML